MMDIIVGRDDGGNQVAMLAKGSGSFGNSIYLPRGCSSAEPIAAAFFN
jgi:hypothetical protein